MCSLKWSSLLLILTVFKVNSIPFSIFGRQSQIWEGISSHCTGQELLISTYNVFKLLFPVNVTFENFDLLRVRNRHSECNGKCLKLQICNQRTQLSSSAQNVETGFACPDLSSIVNTTLTFLKIFQRFLLCIVLLSCFLCYSFWFPQQFILFFWL